MRCFSSRRVIAATLCVTGALVAGGCNDFLKVDNPGAIETPELSDPRYITLLQNGAMGQFQAAFGQTIIYGSTFTDEGRNHHVFFENKAIDRRDVPYDNGTFNLMYVSLQRARFLLSVDMFNVLNSNTVLSQNRNLAAGAFGTINEIISPRIARLGIKFQF